MSGECFVHPLSDVRSTCIGKDTRIWQYTVVLPGARIGSRCNVCCHCFIENDVHIGDNVTVKSGVFLWDGMRIGNDVFIGPNVTFINDRHPRSGKHPQRYLETFIEDGASIGAGSVVMGGVRIGREAMVGAGSLVTKDVPPATLWYGHPARYVRDVESSDG